MVSGRVQGVFFRDSCRTTALAHGVSGWVRNLPGGEVEAVFEGEEEAVASMVRWARTGPPAAEVRGIDVRDEPSGPSESEHFSGFEVLPTPWDQPRF
ncbi:acylphosphatase [Streptomyces bambusae]|uniref:Acylphosphatase n=1 Tax=Streptomyces bambusae TaxID=1550616 RepID=A0ABS6Z3V9_9ACTN|nr:acylphosphatase [Streptomyces bambusae]